ncbi:MAG TPA: radical SAM/SPASM domain-containing protein [Candidatus Wujingus californicus]|uniref:radical SAM/SPASM domain-containing protein n=1 Tax=Candidatus Wujingus californicus TaxID=3367618 RepID=UPI004026E698
MLRYKVRSLLIKIRILSLIRFLKSLKTYCFSRYPQQINWAITGSCNSRCIFCEAHEQLSNQNDVPTNRIFSLIDEMSNVGINSLLLVGGEVLTRKDIFDILSYVGSKGFRVQIITNSLLIPYLNNKSIEVIKKNVCIIGFSLDSADAEQYDLIRGIPGAFKKVLKSIELLAGSNIKQYITTVICAENMEQIPKLIKLSSELGLKSVHFQPISPVTIFENTKVKEGKLQLLLKNEKDLNLLDKYISEGINASKKYCVETNLKLFKLFARAYFQNYLESKSGKGFFMESVVKHHRCLSVFSDNFIDYDGSFKLCPLLPAIGNVKEENLQDILSKIVKFRTMFKKRKIPLKFCKNCFCAADTNLEFSIFFSPFKNWHLFRYIL